MSAPTVDRNKASEEHFVLPGLPIELMSEDARAQTLCIIAKRILGLVVASPQRKADIPTILFSVANELEWPQRDMVYGLRYGEDLGVLAIDNSDNSVSATGLDMNAAIASAG